MAFWSGERLKDLVPEHGIVAPYSESMIDCSAVTLTLGPEFFVSPDHSVAFQDIRKHWLKPPGREEVRGHWQEIPGEEMVIPPGQFAYLLSEEFVHIPNFAMGFISLKFGVKGPGLVNVSGFHVDPGYHGRLIFSVYNAGPAPTRLHRGQRVFLLWLADLDRESSVVKTPTQTPRSMISEEMISKVDRRIHSLQELSKAVEQLKEELRFFKRVVGIALTIVLASVSLAGMIFGALKYYGSP